jgi:hypothetical protein
MVRDDRPADSNEACSFKVVVNPSPTNPVVVPQIEALGSKLSPLPEPSSL